MSSICIVVISPLYMILLSGKIEVMKYELVYLKKLKTNEVIGFL